MAKNPTLPQLRAFRAVATELHFGRAAARLHTSQPPLTRHIQALEEAVGVALFHRNTRNVELTSAGAAFLAEVEVAIARLDRATVLAHAAAAGQSGGLSIGFVEPLGVSILPQVMSQFILLHPNMDLELYQLDTRDQIARLHEGSLDCGFIRAPANVDPRLSFEPVCTDVFVAALPHNHPLALTGVVRIDLAQLADEPFITYEGTIGQGMISALLSGCATAGFTPGVRRQVQSTVMVLAHVAAGDGVALVSSEVARTPRKGIRFVPLTGDPAGSTILLAWRRGETSAARKNLLHLTQRATATTAKR